MISHRLPQFLSRKIIKCSYQNVRHHNFDGETYVKTSMSLITREDESHNYVAAYSTYGFRLSSGFHVLGPCAVFPRTVLHWNMKEINQSLRKLTIDNAAVPSASKITPASLSLFCMLEPKLDILLIGKGEWDAPVAMNIVTYLRSKKINVEILPTEQACSTFNFLNSEKRIVAAGLIPPSYIGGSEEDFAVDPSVLELGSMEEPGELDEFPEVTKTMASFKEKGVFQTLSRHRKGHSGVFKHGEGETHETDDKGKTKR